jgi:hypothetical protein
MITVNGVTKLAGCYIGSSLGFWHGAVEAASLADGYLQTDYYQQAKDMHETEDMEALISLLDKIDSKLNAVTIGGYFIWVDGEYFLVEDGSEHDLYIRGEP